LDREGRDAIYTVSRTVTVDGRAAPAPMVTCGLAIDRGEYVWSVLTRQQPTAAPRPEALPWLGIVLHPTMALLSRDEAMMLGDLERCIAWTIIEEDRRVH
jgi:hypothetical protein